MKRQRDGDGFVAPAPKKRKENDARVQSQGSEEGKGKFTMFDYQDTKGLKAIQRQKGFENETDVLGNVSSRFGKNYVDGEDTSKPEQYFQEGGNVIEPFHLKRERQEGTFDQESGLFRLEKRKEGEQKDFYLDHEMEKLEEGSRQNVKLQEALAKKEKVERENAKVNVRAEQLKGIIALVKFMIDGETVKKTIDRLKLVAGEPSALGLGYGNCTTVTSRLISFGMFNLFDHTKEKLLSIIAKNVERAEWEYKWDGSKEKVYGPFDTESMRGWFEKGFFNFPNFVVRMITMPPKRSRKKKKKSVMVDDDEEKKKERKEPLVGEFVPVQQVDFYAYR